MNTIIASESIFGQNNPNEEPFEITVEIGAPYQVSANKGEWACPVSIEPLSNKLHDVHGETSFQALCLAISLAQDLLQVFKENGGKLTDATGYEFSLKPYSFGVAAGRGVEIDTSYFQFGSLCDSTDTDDQSV